MKLQVQCPCPCEHKFYVNPASLMAKKKSEARSEQARINGAKSKGRPKTKDANVRAHEIVGEVIKRTERR